MIKLKSLFRRGQGGSPSASSGPSKSSHNISPAHSTGIKSSASASSLDRIAIVTAGSSSADLGATRKLSKGHKQSSKDKLNDLLKVSSKEKLFDEKKELKKQQKHQKQMHQVAHQSQSSLQTASSSSKSLDEQRTERLHSKDLDSASFGGTQEVTN
jgi:alanyl-tRNA synthetase